GGALRRALEASKFTGRLGEILDVPGAPGIAASHVVLYGLGKPEELRDGKLEDIGGGLTACLSGLPGNAAAIVVDLPAKASVTAPAAAAHLAYGGRLRSYRFDKYRT